MGSIARATQYQMIHFIRGTVTYNQAGIATGVVIGHLPNGCRISGVDVYVEVAQNAATTNTLSVGTIAETNGVLSAAVTAVTNLVSAAAAGTAAFTKNTPTIANVVAATDLAVVVSLAQSGTAATAGTVTVVVTYIPNL